MKHERSMAMRILSAVLCLVMVLGMVPAGAFAASAAQTAAVSPMAEEVEYVSLPVTIRDFAADGMLFEFNQTDKESNTYASQTYSFDTGSMESGYSWSTNNHLGFRIRPYSVFGSELPYAHEYWYCVIVDANGSIVKVLPSGKDSKAEYAAYMTSGCYSVWLWIADGETAAHEAQYQVYKQFEALVTEDNVHGCTIIRNDAGGTFTVQTKYKTLNIGGRDYLLGDNNGYTLLLTDSSDYINNLTGSDSIPGTTVVQNSTGWNSPEVPDPMTVTLNSGAPQYVYGANLRTDLVTANLDGEKKPIYTEATVTYLADLLRQTLEVPYTITLGDTTYHTGYYILGVNLFDKNFRYVGKNSVDAQYGLADVLRHNIPVNALGSYSESRAKFESGALSVASDAKTYFDAAYYLLHYVWRDSADEGYTGNDGYGWNTWNYDKINLVQTTNDAGQKCYVFNSGYDDTAYEPMGVTDGEIVGSGAIYNTQVETITPAKNKPVDSDGNYIGTDVYSSGNVLPDARFDPLGTSGSGQSFGYGMDQGIYCELMEAYPDRGELFYPETNYHLTLEGHAKFIYYKDASQYFTFTGDDDVYLYINGVRVLDIGAAHSIARVQINLNDVAQLCGLSDGMTYDFDFYYMERHGTAANFGIETNIQIVDPSMLTSKQGYQNGEPTGYNGFVNPNLPVVYEFALQNDGQSAVSGLTFVDKNIGVSLTTDAISLNSLTSMKDLSVTLYAGDGTVKSSAAAGTLTEDALKTYLANGLEVGEKIVIHGFSYRVQDADWQCRYVDKNSNGIFDEGDERTSNWYFFNIIYTTATAEGDNNSTKELTGTSNWVVQKLQEEKMGPLSITKRLGEDASNTLLGELYTMQVLLDDKPLPVGTVYTVGDTQKTVTTAGQIRVSANQTAVIGGIAYGTAFQVRELISPVDRNVYEATYDAVNAAVTEDGVTGTITQGAEASVIVTNFTKPNNLIETDKWVTADSEDPNHFTLTLEALVKGDLTGITTTTPSDIVLVLDQSASMYAPAGGEANYFNQAILGTDIASYVETADLDPEKAKHMGYYVAQSYSGRPIGTDENGNTIHAYDWFLVQYIGDTWYFVRKSETAMPVTLDPAYSGSTGEIGATLSTKDLSSFGFNYYQSGYGALYDAVHSFVDKLKATGVDHRVAVVGFASPFYDAMEYFDGSGVYVNGQYYLYDTEYFQDEGGIYSYINKEGLGSKYYLTNEQIAALPTAGAETVYDKAMVSVRTETGYQSVKNSLDAVTTNYWHTCPAAGLDMANHILAATGTADRNQTVILFTDGVPTVRLDADYEKGKNWNEADKIDGLYQAHYYWTVAQGKDSALEVAYETKNTYGVTIHTVGTSGAGADKLFLSAVSSDYPDATYYPTTYTENGVVNPFEDDKERQPTEEEIRAGMGDPIAQSMYTHFVGNTQEDSLGAIFDKILQTSSALELGSDAVLKEILTDYFELDSNSEVDVTVYTAAYDGKGGYAERKVFDDAKVSLYASDGGERLDTIEVTGFDYAAEYVSDTARTGPNGETDYYGRKLIVELEIRTRDGFWGGNNVPTNESGTAIYEADGDVVDPFPEPQVNVPLSLTIDADDAVVYYGSEVLPAGLMTGLQAGGMDVVINSDGTLSPAEAWMADYATLTWNGSVAPREGLSTTDSGDYIYAASMAPKYTGTENTSTFPSNLVGDPISASGIHAQDRSHVDVLVPVIPFQDSTITAGTTPDDAYFAGNNLVKERIEWVLIDDLASTKDATHGSAPELSFAYDPDTDDGQGFDEATAVEVTVQGTYEGKDPIDLTKAAWFDWISCRSGLHDEPTIARHAGGTANQNEFWIHVSDTSNSGLYTDKYVEATADPNEFVLTLESYAMGEEHTITKPADIVLVLDHSGSMRTPAGATEVLKSGTLYTGPGKVERSEILVAKAKHRGYYVAQSQETLNWFIMEHVDNYPLDNGTTGTRWVGYLVPTTESIVDTTAGNYTEHTQVQSWVPGSVPDSLVFYKSQYAVLYDALLDFVGDLKASGVEHNVAIVGFAGSEGHGTRLYVGSSGNSNSGYKYYRTHLYHENTTQARRDELYQLAMKNVQDATEYAELLSNINLIETNHSFTCPTAGLQLANEVFAANAVNMAERDRIVVLFTDGIPNRQMGEELGITVDDAKQLAIYEEIVSKAAETKGTYGASVFSICTTTLAEGVNGENRTFLDYSSSNYPDAKSYSNPGAKKFDLYFHKIDGFDALSQTFDTITQSTTSVKLDENAILKEVLTDYFELNPNTDVDVEVYTAAYDGKGGFAKAEELTGAGVVLSSSDGSERLDTIEVAGFDYQEEYLSNVARTVDGKDYFGSKLIVKVHVRTRDGFWGGNNVPTNEETTGIYTPKTDANGNPIPSKSVEDFPEPEVNVPIDVTITAQDKTIYYGGDIDEDDDQFEGDELLQQITAGGMTVQVQTTVHEDGTVETQFVPQESWMDDFADMTWSEDSTTISSDLSSTEPADYTYGVTVTPKYEGTANRQDNPGNIAGNIDGGTVENTPSAEKNQSAEDTGHIYILVPELTFKDSVTDYGTPTDGYDFQSKDFVKTEWVFMEDSADSADAPAPSGTAPELTLTYTPENDVTEFVDDTKVEVGVALKDNPELDISDVTVFHWEDCPHDEHAGCGSIKSHRPSGSSHEFWVHVKVTIVPDTVVIDFGLSVDVHPLENDLTQFDNVTKVLNGIGGDFADTYTGTFGAAHVIEGGEDESDKVRYTLNTSNGMQMSREETFAYQGSYTIDGKTMTAESTITVIPATIIYYEDSFLTYHVFDYEKMEEITPENYASFTNADGTRKFASFESVAWKDTGIAGSPVQDEDRPGADLDNALAELDADNIYGYDPDYHGMNSYSLGSGKLMKVDSNVYGTAEFTFSGTGFDVISVTDNTSGTILVRVFDTATGKSVKNLMVDNYYGYQYTLCNVTYVCREDSDGELYWDKSVDSVAEGGAAENPAVKPENPQVGDEVMGVEYAWFVNKGASDALYQVPVMKVKDLPYGTYRVEISISYSDFLDHNGDGWDTFCLDAIRIYDPANDGAGNKLIEDAYVADGEGWPSYEELRNMVIAANDFKALEEGKQTEGVIFIDNTNDTLFDWTYSIEDYTNFGPNNELYLAPQQAVSFDLDAKGDVAAVHLALKTVCNSANVKVYAVETVDGQSVYTYALGSDTAPQVIDTATDLYYDITDLNGKTVVIANTDTTGGAILSITNIKTTYNTAPTADSGIQLTVSRVSAQRALDSLQVMAAPKPYNPFQDVREGMFCYEPILWAVSKGITNGMTDSLFGTESLCNRAQVVTFLWRAAGCPEPTLAKSAFVDVPVNSFCYKAVQWAVEMGITNGIDAEHFGPSEVCNRATVVTFLWRAKGCPAPTAVEHPFTDVKENSFYYRAMLWAVENGITNGMSAAAFAPTSSCTRAQVVTFLYRAYR